jgi:hypothetical protein
MRVFPTLVLVVSVWMVARQGLTQQSAPLLIDAIQSSTARFAVQRAIRAAVERLECAECGKVLSDFRDARGRTVQARLDLLGDPPGRYLTRLTFREAVDRRCQDPATLAFTYLQSSEVFICGTQCWRKYQQDSRYVEALIIHEMLHTLGLGENPPSSIEINRKVLKRCWSAACGRRGGK